MSSLLTDNVDISLKYAAHYNDVKESLLKNSPGVLNAPRFKAFQDFVEQEFLHVRMKITNIPICSRSLFQIFSLFTGASLLKLT